LRLREAQFASRGVVQMEMHKGVTAALSLARRLLPLITRTQGGRRSVFEQKQCNKHYKSEVKDVSGILL